LGTNTLLRSLSSKFDDVFASCMMFCD
jgi:hypothetical protein